VKKMRRVWAKVVAGVAGSVVAMVDIEFLLECGAEGEADSLRE
jgi:hypothetical protein